MKKVICILLCLLLLGTLGISAVSLDEHALLEGMEFSWYQGYSPIIRHNTLYLHLPIREEAFAGEITADIALTDPHVFLLADPGKEVTVSPKNGIYPLVFRLSLEKNRRNGDYPAVITLKGKNAAGVEILETLPYVIRIRDGRESHESFTPLITGVTGDLEPGREGLVSVTLTNPTTTLSMTDGELALEDPSGQILMAGADMISVPEVLPGQSVTVSVPVTVLGDAELLPHRLSVSLGYRILEREAQWTGQYTVPVNQNIRLEQGALQLPEAIAGDLATLTLPLMNVGKGTLENVLVKLEMDAVLTPQSVLVGTLGPGETKQAKLTFTPGPDSLGTHSGTVTVTCEDAYGNPSTQVTALTLTVTAPIPANASSQTPETPKASPWLLPLAILCPLLTAAWITHAALLTGKLRKLEEERL